jgi:hypothetical protein
VVLFLSDGQAPNIIACGVVVASGRSVASGRPELVFDKPEGFRMAIDVN